jgi:hypothetical protein
MVYLSPSGDDNWGIFSAPKVDESVFDVVLAFAIQ